jgi:PKD repeat protein
MNKKFFYVSVFLIFVLFLSGCGTSDIVIPDGSGEDEVQPINHAPTIISTPDIYVTVGQTYNYDVNATDPDGDTLNFSLSDKPSEMIINSSTGLISWVPASAGNYEIIVKVTDGDLLDTQEFNITVSTVTTESYTISSSSGPNGSINPSGSTTVAQEDDQTFYIIPDEGYQIADVIVDETSVGTVISYTFTDVVANHSIHADFVEEASINQPPIADFDVDFSSGVAPLNVSFDASNSYDPDGYITSYNWDFKDGATDSGEAITHTFNSAGSYNVKLIVTDNKGVTDSTTRTITVTEPIIEAVPLGTSLSKDGITVTVERIEIVESSDYLPPLDYVIRVYFSVINNSAYTLRGPGWLEYVLDEKIYEDEFNSLGFGHIGDGISWIYPGQTRSVGYEKYFHSPFTINQITWGAAFEDYSEIDLGPWKNN